jgi:hypothetical protein
VIRWWRYQGVWKVDLWLMEAEQFFIRYGLAALCRSGRRALMRHIKKHNEPFDPVRRTA